MQINIEEPNYVEESFFFEPIQNKALQTKEMKEVLTKWGLIDTMKIGSFRFNQAIHQYDTNRFMLDLFNSPNLKYIINNIPFPAESVSDIKWQKIRCCQQSMQLFDTLEKEKLVSNEYIQKTLPEYYEGIEICDKIRECLLMEESQTYCVFDQAQRKELLFKLFQMFLLGGSLNQYEDKIGPYLESTKKIYKALVSVRKKPESKEIYIESQAYMVESIGKAFKTDSNPQNLLYVIVNPSQRTCHVISNTWAKHW